MPVSDLDITRSAHLYIQMHGDEAIAKAREMVEAMRLLVGGHELATKPLELAIVLHHGLQIRP